MQEVFEKIIEKLEEIREQKTCTKEKCDEKEICRTCVVDDAIKIMKKEAEQYNNGWIPCSERLPEENTSVIACFIHGAVMELEFYDGIFHGIYDYTTKAISAWMPLPEPYQPKGE